MDSGESVDKAPKPKTHLKYIDECSSHRHDPPGKSATKKQTPQHVRKAAKRPCPMRNTRSKSFNRVLSIAKTMKSISVKSEVVINDHERHFTLTASSGVTHDVEISNCPDCSCRYCSDRDVCSHVLWLLLNRFKVPESDYMLHQRGYTSHELDKMFAQKSTPKKPSKEGSQHDCKWSVSKHSINTKPRCPTCHCEITNGDLKITCEARWTPPHKNKDGRSFTVPRTFHFCLKWECVSADPPQGSTIKQPPTAFAVDPNVNISQDEWQVITFLDLPLM